MLLLERDNAKDKLGVTTSIGCFVAELPDPVR
jgi:hypothetical protein